MVTILVWFCFSICMSFFLIERIFQDRGMLKKYMQGLWGRLWGKLEICSFSRKVSMKLKVRELNWPLTYCGWFNSLVVIWGLAAKVSVTKYILSIWCGPAKDLGHSIHKGVGNLLTDPSWCDWFSAIPSPLVQSWSHCSVPGTASAWFSQILATYFQICVVTVSPRFRLCQIFYPPSCVQQIHSQCCGFEIRGSFLDSSPPAAISVFFQWGDHSISLGVDIDWLETGVTFWWLTFHPREVLPVIYGLFYNSHSGLRLPRGSCSLPCSRPQSMRWPCCSPAKKPLKTQKSRVPGVI